MTNHKTYQHFNLTKAFCGRGRLHDSPLPLANGACSGISSRGQPPFGYLCVKSPRIEEFEEQVASKWGRMSTQDLIRRARVPILSLVINHYNFWRELRVTPLIDSQALAKRTAVPALLTFCARSWQSALVLPRRASHIAMAAESIRRGWHFTTEP